MFLQDLKERQQAMKDPEARAHLRAKDLSRLDDDFERYFGREDRAEEDNFGCTFHAHRADRRLDTGTLRDSHSVNYSSRLSDTRHVPCMALVGTRWSWRLRLHTAL